MTDLELKKELIQRIIQYEPVSDGLINNLLQKSVAHLEDMLGRLVQDDADERVEAHRQQAQRESQLEAAYVQALRQISLNGRRLTDSEATRNMLESLLNPGETPTLAIYQTLALQFATKFAWETPKVQPSKEDQRKAFDAFVRERGLSSCEANFSLFRDGAGEEHYAGASGIERAQYASEAAAARQKWLINSASPSELKAESAYESQINREQAQRGEATRRHQFVMQQQKQSGNYQELPATDENGVVIDSRYIKKLSTLDMPRFKAMVRRYGTSSVTQRLRGE
jgi:hypothetical protein